MYIDKYWGNFIGGSDDSLNLVAFLEDLKKEEIPLSEIFTKIGLDKQNWDFRQTVEYLEFTHSNGVEMDFHFAIDVVTDLAAILLECSVSGGVNLHDLDEYNTPARRIRITACLLYTSTTLSLPSASPPRTPQMSAMLKSWTTCARCWSRRNSPVVTRWSSEGRRKSICPFPACPRKASISSLLALCNTPICIRL